MSKSDRKTNMLAEAGVTLGLSLALSYLKIPIGLSFGGFGGSIDLVMIPLILFALRWGAGWGVLTGFAFGLLKYFLAGGFAISWASMILDYTFAYAAVGLAGVFCKALRKNHMVSKKSVLFPVLGAFLGCLGRFFIHYLSGVTIYAQYMPETFLDKTMSSASVYSILYNGTYMLPNTIIALILTPILWRFVRKIK